MTSSTTHPAGHLHEGDVVVDAAGRPHFVKVLDGRLYTTGPSHEIVVDLEALEYPVSVIYRDGDPTTDILIEKVPAGTAVYTAHRNAA